jgi:hypothetical protein
VDAVQSVLYSLIRQRHEDGSLQKEWELWGLGTQLAEWLVLATAPPTETKVNPVLSIAQTPGLHYIFIDMLFVGLSDNTRLESYVSLYKTHNHAKMSPTTIEAMFLYHAGLELERLQLRSSEMRSMMGGALGTVARQRALDSKPLRCHHHASKKQQSELCRLALARAKSYDRARYFRRGATGLLRIYATEAATQASFRDSSAKRKAVAQIATCHVTEGGKRRRPAPPPEAYWHLLNPLHEPDAKITKKRGTGYGNTALAVKAKAEAARKRLQKPAPGVVVPTVAKSGKRKTEKALRNLTRPNAVPPLKKRRRKPRAVDQAREQRVGDNLADELDSAAAEEERAAAELQRCEEAEADAARRLDEIRLEAGRLLREDGERAAAARAAAAAAAETTAAEAAAARAQHAEQAKAREISEIKSAIKSFRDEFRAKHSRSPTHRDMQRAQYLRQRMMIERYNQLQHGIAPPTLTRQR